MGDYIIFYKTAATRLLIRSGFILPIGTSSHLKPFPSGDAFCRGKTYGKFLLSVPSTSPGFRIPNRKFNQESDRGLNSKKEAQRSLKDWNE
jgi:hypothetical protein